jgi:antitoxin component of RelBE/YafQ-DinJ toxin-antitoxin module
MKFNVPERKYCDGEKKMVATRLPMKLKAELAKIAKKKGWDYSELVMTVLDQYVQWEHKNQKG